MPNSIHTLEWVNTFGLVADQFECWAVSIAISDVRTSLALPVNLGF